MEIYILQDISSRELLDKCLAPQDIHPDPNNPKRRMLRESGNLYLATLNNRRAGARVAFFAGGVIVDENFKPLSSQAIANNLFIPFTSIQQFMPACTMILAQGGLLPTTLETEKKILQWPLYINPQWTGRELTLAHASILRNTAYWDAFFLAPPQQLKGKTLFAKPVHKLNGGFLTFRMARDLSAIIYDSEYPFWQWIEDDIPIIWGDFREIARDNKDRELQYRALIINRRISSISLQLDYDTDYEIPDKAIVFTLDFITAHKELLPAHYTLDIGIAKDSGEYFVVELNPLWSSGRYEKCDHVKFVRDALAILPV